MSNMIETEVIEIISSQVPTYLTAISVFENDSNKHFISIDLCVEFY